MARVSFFDRQASLRRLTVRLLILTTIGSIGIACLGAAVSGYMHWARAMETSGIVDPLQLQRAALTGAAITFTFTLLAVCVEFVKLKWLRGSVRHLFHASKLDDLSRKRGLAPPEQRLLNVVDEMSIAASLPRPQIQLLGEDPTINSFALSRGNRQAIIGVTAGAMTQLSREELQALIAHELAHIANGDAAINVGLLALIKGFRLIYDASVTVIGAPLRKIEAANVAFAITFWLAMVFGVFFVLGLFGVGIARLMQAAIARQREYLADASAVQFSRATSGLLSALEKAEQCQQGSQRKPTHAAAFMMFVSPYRATSWLFRTHPKTSQRIAAVNAMTPRPIAVFPVS